LERKIMAKRISHWITYSPLQISFTLSGHVRLLTFRALYHMSVTRSDLHESLARLVFDDTAYACRITFDRLDPTKPGERDAEIILRALEQASFYLNQKNTTDACERRRDALKRWLDTSVIEIAAEVGKTVTP
jgi:hypothetical protein